jgi:hypothetical protein
VRRETSTVVVLVGRVAEGLLAGLGRFPNVTVVRAPSLRPPEDISNRPAWERGAQAMREAAHRRSTYVIVPDDPLADVAASWRAMWDVPGQGAAEFEQQAAQVLAAWRGKQFELPDYYLVMTPSSGSETGPDLHLGPLRAVRPRRVAVARATGATAAASGTSEADGAQEAERVLDALRALEHGAWWPDLGRLLDSVRDFYAGGLTETQNRAVSG